MTTPSRNAFPWVTIFGRYAQPRKSLAVARYMLSVFGPPVCRARFMARSAPLIFALYQSAFTVRSMPASVNLKPVSTPPSPPEYVLFRTVIWSLMIARETLPVVPSGVITWTQTATVASKFGLYARVVSPVSSVWSSAGSRDSPPRAVENPGAAIWLRLLKLLNSAELQSHEVCRLVPAVAGETWSAAVSAAAATATHSEARRRVILVIVNPPSLLTPGLSLGASGRVFNDRDRVAA